MMQRVNTMVTMVTPDGAMLLTSFLDRLPQLPSVWMVLEMSVSVRETSGSCNTSHRDYTATTP